METLLAEIEMIPAEQAQGANFRVYDRHGNLPKELRCIYFNKLNHALAVLGVVHQLIPQGVFYVQMRNDKNRAIKDGIPSRHWKQWVILAETNGRSDDNYLAMREDSRFSEVINVRDLRQEAEREKLYGNEPKETPLGGGTFTLGNGEAIATPNTYFTSEKTYIRRSAEININDELVETKEYPVDDDAEYPQAYEANVKVPKISDDARRHLENLKVGQHPNNPNFHTYNPNKKNELKGYNVYDDDCEEDPSEIDYPPESPEESFVNGTKVVWADLPVMNVKEMAKMNEASRKLADKMNEAAKNSGGLLKRLKKKHKKKQE